MDQIWSPKFRFSQLSNLDLWVSGFWPLFSHVQLLHTIRKVKFLSKKSISRVFHPKSFLTIFLVKSKLSTAKKSKTTTFSRVFHPPKIDNFLGKSKLNFWSKNKNFEQCENLVLKLVLQKGFFPSLP